MSDPQEIERRAFDIARWAKVESREGKRVVVRAGDVVSGPIPWFALRCGDTFVWSPPSPGEQGVLLCPEGELQLGLFFPGIESTAFPLPGDGPETIGFKDTARFSYDPESHVLEVSLPAGGKARFAADLEVDGDVAVTGDVVAGPISLRHHKTPNIQRGADLSDEPQ